MATFGCPRAQNTFPIKVHSRNSSNNLNVIFFENKLFFIIFDSQSLQLENKNQTKRHELKTFIFTTF